MTQNNGWQHRWHKADPVETISEIKIAIDTAADIVSARQRARDIALTLGFSSSEATVLAAVISELTRNIVLYAKSGELCLQSVTNSEYRGVVIIASDNGPGIPDIQRALMGGYSTSGGLGLGLSGTKRMVDELVIDSKVGQGTVVTAKKWQRRG